MAVFRESGQSCHMAYEVGKLRSTHDRLRGLSQYRYDPLEKRILKTIQQAPVRLLLDERHDRFHGSTRYGSGIAQERNVRMMKAYAMLRIGSSGWIEKERPVCGPMDAIVKPLAVAPCTSDIHTVWEGAIGEREDMILGHEGCGEVVEVGALVKSFKVGDRVLIPAITPDWNSLEAQAGFAMHSGGMLGGWKFSNFKDGVFAEYCHVNDADGNLALMYEGINRPQAMDEAQLLAKVASFVQADPELPVYVAGDGEVRYQTVYALMGKLQGEAKVSRVSLMGSPADTGKGK